MPPLPQVLRDRLSAADQTVLRRQGFVAADRLPSGFVAHKLRFRDLGGRQRVVYLGVDYQLAAGGAGLAYALAGAAA